MTVEHGSQSSERSMMTSQLAERKKTVASNRFGNGFFGTEWRITVRAIAMVMSVFGSIAAFFV